MNIIYIDTNIFLGFYNSNRLEYKKLLGSVVELIDKIFFTQQMAYEIERNKLNVFRQSIDNYTKQVSLITTMLPEHLDEESSPKLALWNKHRYEIEKEISASNNELKLILKEVLNDVHTSKDKVSQNLLILYSKAIQPTLENLEKARHRKEIGNPPGKRSDPLGDQLSWQQLLDFIPKTTNLWIVTTDKDYFIEHQKIIYLNPILNNEIIALNPEIKIKTFNVLAEALRDYDKQEKIKSIPSDEVLNQISISEEQDLSSAKGSTSTFKHSFTNMLPSKPTFCPKCEKTNSFLDGAYLHSQYGGLTLQFICKNCGLHYDTVDYFD